MQEPTRASDQTTDMMMAKNAGDKLVAALAELSKWKMEISCEVEHDLNLRITVRKHDGSGLIKVLTKDQVLYFVDDSQAFVQQLAWEIFEMLLKDQIVKFLSDPITKAMANITMIVSKSP
jgi:hypothetical protein